MWKIITFLLMLFSDNAYTFSLSSPNGAIHLSDYQGKYILLVNTATNSQYVSQYGKLEQLYQQFRDSLVIIAIPSNDFGNEPMNDDSIQNLVAGSFNIHYLLASKTVITGSNSSPLYQWLVSANQNNVMTDTLIGDFQKYLIDKNGNLVGIFAPSVDPLSDQMKNPLLPPDQRVYVTEQEDDQQ